MHRPISVQMYSVEMGGTPSFPTAHHAASDGTFGPDVSGCGVRTYGKAPRPTPQSIHIYIYVPPLDFFQICKVVRPALDRPSITRAAGQSDSTTAIEVRGSGFASPRRNAARQRLGDEVDRAVAVAGADPRADRKAADQIIRVAYQQPRVE